MFRLIRPVHKGPVCTREELLDQRIDAGQAAGIRKLFTRLTDEAPKSKLDAAVDAAQQAQHDLQQLADDVEAYEETLVEQGHHPVHKPPLDDSN